MYVKQSSTRAVTTRLTGGLGNQLFKFMAGVKFTEDLNVDVVFDISTYDQDPIQGMGASSRSFELDYFPNLKEYRFNSSKPFFYRLKLDRIIRKAPDFVKIKFGFFDDDLSKVKSVTKPLKYIDGNFENADLLPKKPKLLSLLEFPKHKSDWFAALETELTRKSVIAVHVRRGDYLNFPEIYDVLTPAYYRRGIDELVQKIGDSEVWLFSDDVNGAIEWLGNDFKSVRAIETPRATRPGEVMRLISLARGIVTANSTFSWWAAYLGFINDSTKEVVIPAQYFSYQSKLENGLAIKSWITVPC